MVKRFIKQKTEVDGDVTMEGAEDPPDYTNDTEQPDQATKEEEEWCMANWDEVEEDLRDTIKKEGVHPVDPVTIASKSNPIPLKDVKKNWLTSISEGYYCGHNSIRESLQKDTFDAMIGGRIRKVSRWALNTVSPDLRNQRNLAKAELKAQFDKNHGGATLKSNKLSITPSTALCKEDATQRPIIAVRIYHGGSQQVVNDIAYYFHYALMRCNLAQDVH